MSVNVVMPQMGESIFEGTVTKWLKKPGDSVARDEPLFEISTDKVDAEVPSPANGVLREIKVPEGQTVQVNTVVALLDGEGEAAAPAAQPAAAAQASKPAMPASAPAASEPPAAPAYTTQPSPAAATAEPEAEERTDAAEAQFEEEAEEIRSSPLVRRLAKENNVDLRQVRGSGMGGRVSKHDLMQHLESRKATPAAVHARPAAAAKTPAPAAAPANGATSAGAPAPARSGAVEIVPMSVMRKRIAEHMVMSKRTSPHVYSVFQADVTRIVQLREHAKREFEARNGTRLTFTAFMAVAAIEALKQFPVVNTSVQDESVVYKKDINLGIAVALDWGLLVPVVKHAEEKNFLGLQRAINDLAERARTKKLSPDEVQDGTFSITNPGIYGGLFGLPVINQPQVAILGVGGIHKTPTVIDDAIAIRSIVHLTLSFDHRVIDGSVADQFLAAICARLEKWEQPLA